MSDTSELRLAVTWWARYSEDRLARFQWYVDHAGVWRLSVASNRRQILGPPSKDAGEALVAAWKEWERKQGWRR